jgi:hypothetical protein
MTVVAIEGMEGIVKSVDQTAVEGAILVEMTVVTEIVVREVVDIEDIIKSTYLHYTVLTPHFFASNRGCNMKN